MLHSIYDLTTYCRKTTGDVPAKLVGASSTVVGSKMYLFGGRLVTERRMVSDLYMFDLETFVWVKIPAAPGDDVPRARYFHSADAWNNQLVVFGGMSNQPDSPNPDELCVLNDVRFFDLATLHWLPPSQTPAAATEALIPRARYAHLSSVTADRLFVIGGQDFFNTWLDDVCVYDLVSKMWVQKRDYPRHCGTYRSVAVSSTSTVRLPQEDIRTTHPASILGPPGARFKADKVPSPTVEATGSESLIHLPYSAAPTEDHPSDIYLYSNYNFTDVKRELEVFSPLPDTDFAIQERSAAMTGSNFPPGLRFPTGAILGTHLIIAGTYLAHSYQSFSIWVLDLISMTWSRIDPGKAVESGSWFRGCLWAETNKFLIFGNRNGNLVDDYNRRLLSWDHVAVVDLEAFGIYQPPALKIDIRMQELGLATLEERVLTDFEIVCDDGRKIPCSRKILEGRWPWFREQRRRLLQLALSTLDTLPSSSVHVPLPDIPGNASVEDPQVDPRLTPRSLRLSEPYPVTLALLQYFYSMALLTPLQHAPAVLSQLLVLATNYRIDHLASLVKHAMHRALSNSTSVGVYEVATLCSCRSLQIRALKTVMSYTQKRPSRSKGDKDGGGSSRPSDSAGGSGPSGGGGLSGDSKYISRPRGTSDAKWRTLGESSGGSSGYTTRKFAQEHEISIESSWQQDSASPVDEKLPPQASSSLLVPRSHQRSSSSAVSMGTHDEFHAVSGLISVPATAVINMKNLGTSQQEVDDAHLQAGYDDFSGLSQRPMPTAPLPESPGSPRSWVANSVDLAHDTHINHQLVSLSSFISMELPVPRLPLTPIRTYTGGSATPSLISSASYSSLASSSPTNSMPMTPSSTTTHLDFMPVPKLAVIGEQQVSMHDYSRYDYWSEIMQSPIEDDVLPKEHSDAILSYQHAADQYSIEAVSAVSVDVEQRKDGGDFDSLWVGSASPSPVRSTPGTFSRFLTRTLKDKNSETLSGLVDGRTQEEKEEEKKRLKREQREQKEENERLRKEKQKAAAGVKDRAHTTLALTQLERQRPSMYGGMVRFA